MTQTKASYDSIPVDLRDRYLTTSQQKIVKLLADGFMPCELAPKLGLSQEAVRQSLYRANNQLNSTCYTIVHKAYEMGLID